MTPDELDRQMQHAVLLFALSSDPALLSDEEILLAVASDPDDFVERDSVMRALRDLNASGLLHYRNGFAQTTRAATRAAELLQI
ncbi:MAG: hypothetical protein WC558_12510 [Patulibacter sp.]